MNKKLLSALLALGVCFTMTGCDQIPGMDKAKDWLDSVTDGTFLEDKFNQDSISDSTSEEPGEVVYDLEGAKNFLKAQEQASDNKSTRNDYQMMNTITYNGVVYSVAWSVDVTEGVVVKAGDTHTTIDIDQTLSEDLAYVLTATISDKDGNTIEISFNRTALAASALVPAAIEEAPQEGVMYKYYVRQSMKEKDLYFAGSMNGYYFSTTEDIAEAVDLYVEYVDGSTEEFYLCFDHKTDGKMYVGVKLSSDGAHNNIVYESAPVSTFKWNAELKTITTTIPVDKDGKENSEFYLGNYSTHMTISASTISYAGGAGNNVGQLVAMVDRNNVSDNAKVDTTAKELTMAKAYVAAGTLTLPTQGTMFADVAITWEVEGTGATVADGVVTFADIDANTTLTLKATYACGEASKTVDYTFALVKNTPAAIVEGAYALQQDESFGNNATLTGVISKIGTAYDANYGNITVTMIVEGKKIDCYRLTGDGSSELAVGYTITVTGKFTNYKGTIQFGQGCTLDSFVVGDESNVPEIDGEGDAPEVSGDTVTMEAIAARDGWSNGVIAESYTYGDYTATATCTKPNETYGQSTGKYYTSDVSWRLYQAEDASLTISTVEGKYIVSVKITYIAQNTGVLTLGDAQVVSDAVVTVNAGTVTFGVANSGTATNGQARITAIEVICADGEGSGESTITPPEGGETPDAPELPAANSTLTISEVLALSYTSDTTDKYYVTGTITEIYNTTYGNMYITDESGKTLTVYGTYSADGSTRFDAMDASAQPKVGDTVKFYSILSSYSGKNQLKNAWIIEINGEGSGEVTPPAGGDDEGGDEGEVSGVTLVEGQAYAMYLNQGGLNKTLYLTGEMSSTWFATSDKAEDAVYIYAEAANGGYKFYFLGENDAKSYIFLEEYQKSNGYYGAHVSFAAEGTVFSYNEAGCWAATLTNDTFFLGTYGTYDTISASASNYMKAENMGTSQFPALLVEVELPDDGGEGETHEHSYTSTVTAPTCTEAGYTTYTCACGDSYTEASEAATGHSYDNGVVTAPTCTEAGYTTYTCACGYSYTEAGEAATGHTFVEGTCACGAADPNYVAHVHEYAAAVTQPTCTEAGYTTYTCACGDTYTDNEVAALGHDYDTSVTAPTCTAAGYTTYSCGICDDTYTVDGEAAIGHADTDNDYKCNGCSTVMAPEADSTLTIPQAIALAKALGVGNYTTNKYYMTVVIENIYNTTYGNANVVDEDGNKYVIYGLYSADGETRYDALNYKPVAADEISVYGIIGSYNATTYQMKSGWIDEVVQHTHDYNEEVTAPTCTMAGYTKYTCSNSICANSYIDNEVAALGHTTEAGTCDNCGQEIGGDAVVAQYQKVTSASEFTTGTYVLVVNSKNVTVSTYDGSWIKGSSLTASNTIDKTTGDALAIELEVSDAGVKIKIGGQYVKPKSGNTNGIMTGSYDWAYEFQADGTIVFKGVGTDTTVLAYNVQSSGFRAYKTSTVAGNASGYPSYFTAYKLVG